jgi:hypothetical protein
MKDSSYILYLEALVLSLLAEREANGAKNSDIYGNDSKGRPTTYSPYNAKDLIKKQRTERDLGT